jgi:hypothetical protein
MLAEYTLVEPVSILFTSAVRTGTIGVSGAAFSQPACRAATEAAIAMEQAVVQNLRLCVFIL